MRITKPVQKAMDAFWEEITKQYPQVKTGDLDPMTVALFEGACARTVAKWLLYNLEGGE